MDIATLVLSLALNASPQHPAAPKQHYHAAHVAYLRKDQELGNEQYGLAGDLPDTSARLPIAKSKRTYGTRRTGSYRAMQV
jgi:hypothetical protein